MHVYTCMYHVFYMYIYLFILTSIYALKNTVINTKGNIYFVHDMIYLSCLIALLIQGAPGTLDEVYLESLCGGIISNLKVSCLIKLKK